MNGSERSTATPSSASRWTPHRRRCTALEDTLDTLEHVLEDIYVKAYSAGVRPQDLERLREAEARGGR